MRWNVLAACCGAVALLGVACEDADEADGASVLAGTSWESPAPGPNLSGSIYHFGFAAGGTFTGDVHHWTDIIMCLPDTLLDTTVCSSSTWSDTLEGVYAAGDASLNLRGTVRHTDTWGEVSQDSLNDTFAYEFASDTLILTRNGGGSSIFYATVRLVRR